MSINQPQSHYTYADYLKSPLPNLMEANSNGRNQI